jgi:hypothetical protein
MNLNLNHKGFEENLHIRRNIDDGVQYLFKFENGYGASVIKHRGSYGHTEDLWELAVIRFEGADWRLTYETSVTDDVIGWLTDEGVRKWLQVIKDLTGERE